MGRKLGVRLPPFTHGFVDRHGKTRHYFRRPGYKRATLPGLPWSPEFMAAHEAAMEGQEAKTQIGAKRTVPGTVAAVVASYYQHALWIEQLGSATQTGRRPILERFREEHGTKRIAMLQQLHIEKILSSKPRYAKRNWLKALRGLMIFCITEHHIKVDPTANVRLARQGKSAGFMTWKEPQIAQYRAAHPVGTVARLALELMLNVAARRQDACKLGRQHLREGRLTWRPSKTRRSTGKVLSIPLTAEFAAALNAMPPSDSLTFLTTDHGRPFASAAAFGNKFADWCVAAGLPAVEGDDGRTRNFRAHGLRKSALRALAHAGCTGAELMAISGHASLREVQPYIDEVEQDRLATAAMDKRATSIGKL